MPKRERTVTVSSKGQIAIPADVRRELGLVSGRVLRLERHGKTLTLSPEEDLDPGELLRKVRAAWRRHGEGDPVEVLHRRRRDARVAEAKRRERWGL